MSQELDWTLAQASQALAEGRSSAQALAEAALRRARTVQARTNAFLAITAEAARSQARLSDGQPRRHALQGIPMAHKDCFARAGERMTVGMRAQRAPDRATATVLARLQACGAVDIGRLHLSEAIAGPSGNNVQFGDCRNAWNPDYISGGSSSGSAVAVASGSVFAALGTDTGGSVRIPASLNGLFGLKPSFGRVSRYGAFPRSLSVDSIGPLARTAQDCALMMQAIAGPDEMDSATVGIAVPDYAGALAHAAQGLRLGILQTDDELDAEVGKGFEHFVSVAARRSGSIQQRRFDNWPLLYPLGDAYAKTEPAQVHAAAMAAGPDSYAKAIYTRTEPGLHLPAVRYIQAGQLRPIMLQRFIEQAFHDVDVLMLPTLPIAAPRISEMDMEAGAAVHSLVPRLTCLTRPFGYLGLPVMSMPMGLDAHGLPMGVQLVGRPYAEARLLSLAHHLSLDLAWSFKPSSLAAAL